MSKNIQKNGNGSTNGEATTKSEAVTLSAEEKKSWQAFADEVFADAEHALASASRETLLAFALEGVASRIDNKYSTAARKLAALSDKKPGLADLLPTSRKGEKAGLVARAFELATSNPAAAADILAAVTSGKVASLKEVIEKYSPKA